jgi:hypothetical protein
VAQLLQYLMLLCLLLRLPLPRWIMICRLLALLHVI